MCRIGRGGSKRFGVGASDGANRKWDVDRANEDEPGADFFGEDASIPYEAAPEIWSRLVERFVFNSPLKFFHFVSRKRKNRDVRRGLAPQRLRQSIWASHTMSGRSLGCSTPSLARRFSAVRRRRFRRRETGEGRRRQDRGKAASSPSRWRFSKRFLSCSPKLKRIVPAVRIL